MKSSLSVHAVRLLAIALLAPCCSGGGGAGGKGGHPIVLGMTASTASLARVDGRSGRTSRLGSSGLNGFRGLAGMAKVATTNTLYGVDPNLGVLITLNQSSGKGTIVGLTGVAVRGLAYDSNAKVMYATDSDTLYRLNLSTGESTLIGPTGFVNVQGLAFRPSPATLFGIDIATDQLITINTFTGAGTIVGPLGVTGILGFTFDPGSSTLFGATANNLYTINPATGAATLPIPHSVNSQVQGLAPGPTAGTLYAVESLDGEFITLDTGNGAITRRGASGFGDVNGLAFNPAGSALYAINRRTERLLTVDLATGEGSEVTGAVISGLLGGNYTDMSINPTGPVYYAVNASFLLTVDPLTGLGSPFADSGSGELFRGLAFDPVGPTLYACSDTNLYTLNMTTGAAALVGSLGAVLMRGLEVGAGALYGIDSQAGQLVTINPAGPTVTPVAPLVNGACSGLAFNPADQHLYSVSSSGSLVRIRPNTGRETGVGALGFFASGFAQDPASGVGYAVNTAKSAFIRVDAFTAEGTVLNTPGGGTLSNVTALAFAPTPGTLFATSASNNLLTLNTATGAVTTIGPFGGANLMQALAVDDAGGVLYGIGINAVTPTLWTINTSTGAATAVAPVSQLYSALAFDAAGGLLLACNTATHKLVAVDPLTGIETALGQAGDRLSGLSPAVTGPAIGTRDNPLVLRSYFNSRVALYGRVGKEKLYIKVVNIPFLNNNHTVDLSGLSANADLFTFTDAFLTPQESSKNPATAAESCTGTTTGTGELYILIDGTKTPSGTSFMLVAGT